MSTPTRITHLIDGQPWTGTAERTSPVFNPATGEQSGVLDLASASLVDEVVTSAASAWEEWADASLAKRTRVLFAFRELLNERNEDLAALITAEHGKVHSDALGEVARGLEVVEFACGIPHLLSGGFTEQASTDVDVYSIRQPLGVVAVISPFNFPAMVPMWFFPIAIAAATRSSSSRPRRTRRPRTSWRGAVDGGRAARRRVQRRARRQGRRRPAAGAPRRQGGVLRRLHADRAATSTRPAPAHGKRVQALGGAKNHMLVLPDADLDLAADAAVNAGFGSAGERCMAISVLVAVDPVARRAGSTDRRAHRAS